MITIFNRKELLSTFNLQKQAELRQLLAQNGIEYRVKVTNRNSPSPVSAGTRARTGTFAQKLDASYEYTLFVQTCDWDRANAAMHKK